MRRGSPDKLKPCQVEEIVHFFTVDKLSMAEIAKLYPVTRQAIYKRLHGLGVDTSKATGCKVKVACYWCEKPFLVTRSKWRAKGIKGKSFCCESHRVAWLNEMGQNYVYDRHSMRISRRIVTEIYGELPEGSVVHHEDKNTLNRAVGNLILFACHADHLRWHRGDKTLVTPLWVGSSATPQRQ